jgi:GNAT superfamily N-acetyltransferase
VILEIRELKQADGDDAAGVLCRGMRDNPNNIAAWGLDGEPREQALVRFFRAVLRGLFVHCRVLGAFDGRTLVGVCAMAPPGYCQPSGSEKVRIATSLLLGNKPMVAVRVLKWTTQWTGRDPVEAHWHLGPVAVDAHLQGIGVGGRLMAVFCEWMDEQDAPAYLETDKRENVRFYEKYGFRLDSESQVLGNPNWYMTRNAHHGVQSRCAPRDKGANGTNFGSASERAIARKYPSLGERRSPRDAQAYGLDERRFSLGLALNRETWAAGAGPTLIHSMV